MKLDDIVTNLDLSIKLKDLGLPQSSLFHWVEIENEKQIYTTVWEAKELNNTIACAYTAAELFPMLSWHALLGGDPCILLLTGSYILEYRLTGLLNKSASPILNAVWDDNMANCAAKMIIQCKELIGQFGVKY